MGAAPNGHFGVSQADVRRVGDGQEGKVLPDGHSCRSEGVDQVNKDTEARLDDAFGK
jgi:hypothetical protein